MENRVDGKATLCPLSAASSQSTAARSTGSNILKTVSHGHFDGLWIVYNKALSGIEKVGGDI